MLKRQRSSDDEQLYSAAKQGRRGDTREDHRSSTEETAFPSSSVTPAGSSSTSVSPTSAAFPLTAQTDGTALPETPPQPMEDSSDSDYHRSGIESPDHELPPSDRIDEQLPVTIDVKLENESYSVGMSVTPSKEESYHQIEMKADSLARRNARGRIQFSQGNCIISTTGSEPIGPLTLQSRHDWRSVQKEILARCKDGGLTNPLRLTITRTYEPSKQPAVSTPASQKRSNLLRSGLKERTKRSSSEEGGNRIYISRADLDELISMETVQSIVQEDEEIRVEDKDDLVECIYHKARKLLALFVYARHRLSSLKLLLDDCYNDGDLPLEECPNLLGDSHENLLSLQWIFLAPVFTGEHRELSADVVIPLISKDWCANGSHSDVHKVQMEPSHMEIDGLKKDPNPELALKILRNRRDPSFTNERSVLQVLRKLRHDHIVRLLCTYKHNDTYNMLFPLAECNLRGFIGSRPPNPSKEASVWLLSQLVGLSEALRIIHNYRSSSEDGGNTNRHGSVQTIYHHDLKPENILYFPPADAIESLGNFQIADFGLAKINRIQPSSSSAGTSTSGTATYAPPESDSNPIKLGRRYDIWSMGCIFLELLVWFCYGPDGCREFNESRRLPDNAPYHDDGFFVTRDGKASLRPGVTEWIEKLRAHQSCRERGSLGTTVTLVEGEMLEVNPEKRMKSNRCTKRLKYFLEEMEKERRDPLRSGNPVGSSPSEEYHNAGGSAETPQPFFTGGGAPALVLPEDDPEAPGNIAAAAEFPLSPVQQTEPHRDLLSAPRPSGRLGRLRSTTF